MTSRAGGVDPLFARGVEILEIVAHVAVGDGSDTHRESIIRVCCVAQDHDSRPTDATDRAAGIACTSRATTPAPVRGSGRSCGVRATVRGTAVASPGRPRARGNRVRAVVVDATTGFLDDGLQVHVFEFGAFLQVIEVHHIGIVVLAMVKLEGFFAVVGGQRVKGVRQCGQGVFHVILLN